MATIQDLTKQTLETVYSDLVKGIQPRIQPGIQSENGRTATDRHRAEVLKIYNLFENSSVMQGCVDGLLTFIENNRGATEEKTRLLCAQMLVLGWLARETADADRVGSPPLDCAEVGRKYACAMAR